MPNTHARHLRRNQTKAEQSLWLLLRNRRLHAHKFRRQHPVGPYIADFACITSRLIIEADGGQHIPESDAIRTTYLHAQRWRILRFWNNDILQNPQSVLAQIAESLIPAAANPSNPPGEPPKESPLPLLKGERAG